MNYKLFERERLITKLVLKQDRQNKRNKRVNQLAKEIKSELIGIGKPLNDNMLEFNSKQMIWANNILDKIEQIRVITK